LRILVDTTGRQLKVGQWVVQPYSQGRSIGTRISYIMAVEEHRVQITHFVYVRPGMSDGTKYILLPDQNHWKRAQKRWIAGGNDLVIITDEVAFNAQDGLEDWIATALGGDPLADPAESV